MFRVGEPRPVMMQRLEKRRERTMGGRKEQGGKAGLQLMDAWVGPLGGMRSPLGDRGEKP